MIGDAPINPGDIVVADADGIVVVKAKDTGKLLMATEAQIAKETEVIERLNAGETTLQIYKLDTQNA